MPFGQSFILSFPFGYPLVQDVTLSFIEALTLLFSIHSNLEAIASFKASRLNHFYFREAMTVFVRAGLPAIASHSGEAGGSLGQKVCVSLCGSVAN